MSATKDEEIQHLQWTVNSLKNALYRIDLDVERAARRHLKSLAPTGSLRMGEFLDLLALEIRREVKAEFEAALKMLKSDLVRKALAEKIDEIALKMVPSIREEVSSFLVLPVILYRRKAKAVENGFRKDAPGHVYTALCVKGSTKQCVSRTQEGAWTAFREALALKLMKDGPDGIAEFISTEHPNLRERFERSAPWRHEKIGEFKVEIRLENEA